ncbi:Uncharacterized protein Adt_03546 [Abeliophyllum distichum]|uniref:Uncharacterized protein n=1 Tax=Abeliophyllum distichum TaxID=126358 RepID=A0ABD1W184_9LAMI
MEFLIVDIRSTYHGVLGRPTLKDFQAIKFPMLRVVAKVRKNQTQAMACYINALRKVVKREGVVPAWMTIHSNPMDVDRKELDEDMILDEGLDHRIIGSDSLGSLAKDLEAFLMNLSEPT